MADERLVTVAIHLAAADVEPFVVEQIPLPDVFYTATTTLGEAPQTCFYTAYQLFIVREGEPSAVELTELTEVHVLEENVVDGTITVRAQLEDYTVRSARAHVRRFRELLGSPPAAPDRYVPGDFEANAKASAKQKAAADKRSPRTSPPPRKQQAHGSPTPSSGDAPEADNPKSPKQNGHAANNGDTAPEQQHNGHASGGEETAVADEARRRKKQQQALRELRGRIKDAEIPTEETNGLASFYDVCLCAGPAAEMVAAQPGAPPAATTDAAPPVPCLKSVVLSAWNPPPAQRKLCGDLLYLEVQTIDDGTLHITCTPAGFYVNATNHANFDPTPAPMPCFSHELLPCLLSAAPSFRRAWAAAVAAASAAGNRGGGGIDETIASMVAEGRIDTTTVIPQWNVPVAGGSSSSNTPMRAGPGALSWSVEGHAPDANRAEEDLTNGFGIDDRGAPRDWNDEHQAIRELPTEEEEAVGEGEGGGGAAGPNALTRARLLYRVLQEFHQAALQGAVAIVHGFVSPMNAMEAQRTHVFVHNSIFFSYAVDSPECARAVVGDRAAHKSALLDLRCVTALNRLDIPELKTLATAIIDYRGRRIVAQSVIAGILQGDQASRLTMGAVEHGQQLKTDAQLLAALRKAGEQLLVAERVVPRAPTPRDAGVAEATAGGSAAGVAASPEGEKEKSAAAEGAAALSDESLPPPPKDAASVTENGVLPPAAAPASDKAPQQAAEASRGASKSPKREGRKVAANAAAAAAAATPPPAAAAAAAAAAADGEDEKPAAPEATHAAAAAAAAAADGSEPEAAVQEQEPDFVSICGPMELKGIKGADYRRYILDLVRLTPRDANWVRGPKGSGVWTEWLAVHGDSYDGGARGDLSDDHWERVNAEYHAVLRPEAVVAYARQRLQNWRAKHIRQLMEERKAAKAAERAKAKAAALEKEEKEGEEGDENDMRAHLTQADIELIEGQEDEMTKSLALNVNVFLPYRASVDPVEEAADEERASAVAQMVWEQIIPAITREVKRGTFSPLDGKQLIHMLHGAGLNCRYLGRLARDAIACEADDATQAASEKSVRRAALPVFWLEMLEVEMAARGAKHALAALLRSTPRAVVTPGPILTRFLNCLLGSPEASAGAVEEVGSNGSSAVNGHAPNGAGGPASGSGSGSGGGHGSPPSGGLGGRKLSGKKGSRDRVNSAAWGTAPPALAPPPALDAESLWAVVAKEVQERFRHDLTLWGPHLRGGAAAKRAHKLSLLRRFCEQTGARVLSRRYDFSLPEPFAPTDVLDLVPVSKSCLPQEPSSASAGAVEAAKALLQNGSFVQAYQLAQQAIHTIQSVCLGLHDSCAAAATISAVAAASFGEVGTALNQGTRALALNQQVSGFDSVQAATSHNHLAMFYQSAGQMERSIMHLRAFTYIVGLAAGPHHPELSNAYHRMGQLYQEVGHVPMAMRCMQEALAHECIDQDEHASVLRSVAELLASTGRFKEALQQEKLAYAALRALHGTADARVQRSALAMERLTERAVDEANKKRSQQSNAITSAGAPGVGSAAANGRASSPVGGADLGAAAAAAAASSAAVGGAASAKKRKKRKPKSAVGANAAEATS